MAADLVVLGRTLGCEALGDGWPAAALLDDRAAAWAVSSFRIEVLIAAAAYGDVRGWMASVGEGLRAVGLAALGSGRGQG